MTLALTEDNGALARPATATATAAQRLKFVDAFREARGVSQRNVTYRLIMRGLVLIAKELAL